MNQKPSERCIALAQAIRDAALARFPDLIRDIDPHKDTAALMPHVLAELDRLDERVDAIAAKVIEIIKATPGVEL